MRVEGEGRRSGRGVVGNESAPRGGLKRPHREERRDITANTVNRFQGNPGVMSASYPGQHRWSSY